jgi:hypothetical protein
VLTLGVPDSADFIRGQVVDPDDRPVPRAGLKYKYRSRFGGSGSGSSTTDEQGRFVIAYSPRTPRDLRGSDPKNRYVSATAEGVEGGDDVVLRLAAAEHMTVTVKTEEGTREGLRLWGYNADHTDILIRSNKVEVEGERMRLPIPREPFLLEIAADGHEQIQLGPFDGLAAPRELDVTLASLPGVRGRVTAGGEPVAGARVALHAPVTSQTAHNGYPVRLGDNPSAQGTTGEDGTFRLDLRQGGDFLLRASAEGLAASEFGPIFIDPARGVVGLKLELTPGGAIEGTLWGGEAVAGRIVAISRGDTYAQTARSDREGRFRFEQLTPGPWLVKLAKEEISPHSSTTTSSRAAFKESDIESNCAVIEGQTTRHDISLAGVGEVVLAGTLRMDGAPAVGWKAMLFPGDAGGMLHGSGRLQTTVSEDGSFRLMAPKSGEYRLVLNPPNTSFMALTNTVQLVLGETSWHAEYQTGSVRILNASTAVDSSRALDFLIGDDGRMNLMVKVLGDEQGVAVITGVPVMPADLVRFTLEEMIASQDPTSGGTPVISVDLIPGQEVVVSLP